MVEMTVYTGRECCLCDEAKQHLERLAAELPLAVRYVAIDGDPALEASYREQIPVAFIGPRKVFKYRVDEALLRRRVGELVAGQGGSVERPPA